MQETTAIAVVAPAARRSAADRLRSVWRNIYPFLVVAAIWEIIAWTGVFHPRLFPSLETVARTFYELTLSGILPTHVAQTVLRLFSGFAVAGVIGVADRYPDGALAPSRRHFAADREHSRADPRPRLRPAVPVVVRHRQRPGGAAGRSSLPASR